MWGGSGGIVSCILTLYTKWGEQSSQFHTWAISSWHVPEWVWWCSGRKKSWCV